MELIKTYKEYLVGEPFMGRLRSISRNSIVSLLSLSRRVSKGQSCIQFPYYHHVFDDERKDFERQLKYFKNHGDFVSIDDACSMLAGQVPLSGRYFCVSFDDGYRCCYTNMVDISCRLDVPVIIYLPTDFIGLDEANEHDQKILKENMPLNPRLITYLNWNQCREMLGSKVSFGSHTKTHARLFQLTSAQIRYELDRSKLTIEKELGVPCGHFACPWGKIQVDFDPVVTGTIARELGYRSVVTTNRGRSIEGDDPYLIKRDHVLAGWSNSQLKYFFGE